MNAWHAEPHCLARAGIVLGVLGIACTVALAILPVRHIWSLAFISVGSGIEAVVFGLAFLRRKRRTM